MGAGRYLIVGFWLASVGAAAAADLPSFPKLRVSPGDGVPASCLEWTDGCRVCARQPDGSAACSNIGIACLPQKARCTRP